MRTLSGLVALSMIAGSASAAPPDLLNKSVETTFTATALNKWANGRTMTGVRQVRNLIYISSQGRVFTRMERSEGLRNDARLAGPEVGRLHFLGRQLVGSVPLLSGATQMTLQFEQGGTACRASIVSRRAPGEPIRFKSLNGEMLEVIGHITFSNVRCTIRPGNVFAED